MASVICLRISYQLIGQGSAYLLILFRKTGRPSKGTPQHSDGPSPHTATTQIILEWRPRQKDSKEQV